MRRRLVAMLAALACLAVSPGLAVQPDEVLTDPALEQRARGISEELRCLVGQNQSIDDSDAPLAHDLRVLVRDRLRRGETDEAVRRYIVSRYGEYVLLKPVLARHTLLLWFGPALLLVAGIAGLSLRRRAVAAVPAPLSDTERAHLDDLLSRGRR